jgi:hypothetical protein
MNTRGLKFLKRWIAENVTAGDRGEARAAILATECILEAATSGIVLVHMADDVEALERTIIKTASYLAERKTTGD